MITVTKEAFDNFIRNKAVSKREDWNETEYFNSSDELIAVAFGHNSMVPEENYQIAVKSDNEVTSFLVGAIIDLKTR